MNQNYQFYPFFNRVINEPCVLMLSENVAGTIWRIKSWRNFWVVQISRWSSSHFFLLTFFSKKFLIIEFFGNNFFLLENSVSPLLRFFVAKILHRTVLHCILNDSHKYCCHFSMKTCSCPSRNDDPLKFIKLKFSIGHTKFRFIFFSRLVNVTWSRQLRPIWPNGLFQFYIFQSPVFLYNLF